MNIASLKQRARRILFDSIAGDELVGRRVRIGTDQKMRLRSALKRHYFSQPVNHFAATVDEYLASAEGSQDMHDHAEGRLDHDRERVIPWIANALPLKGARVLEVGCGTGASTVALAEQGARVTAVDVNEGNLQAARERVALYDLEAQFACLNATALHTQFSTGSFDLVVFFATLEHLDYAERLLAIRSTWNLLGRNALWAVVETPNRLWWFDDHTAMLPFYHWLPDELAMDYAARSPRPFMGSYARSDRTDADRLDFARRGRGASFHEFDVAIGLDRLEVVSALNPFLRESSWVLKAEWLLSGERRYAQFLKRAGAPPHAGWHLPYLDLLLRKV